jgi:hypothetical protein
MDDLRSARQHGLRRRFFREGRGQIPIAHNCPGWGARRKLAPPIFFPCGWAAVGCYLSRHSVVSGRKSDGDKVSSPPKSCPLSRNKEVEECPPPWRRQEPPERSSRGREVLKMTPKAPAPGLRGRSTSGSREGRLRRPQPPPLSAQAPKSPTTMSQVASVAPSGAGRWWARLRSVVALTSKRGRRNKWVNRRPQVQIWASLSVANGVRSAHCVR